MALNFKRAVRNESFNLGRLSPKGVPLIPCILFTIANHYYIHAHIGGFNVLYQKEIEITLEAVYQKMGFTDQTAVSPYLKNRVSHFIERGQSKFQPCIYYDMFKIRTDDEQGFLEFANGSRFESQSIFNLVYGCNELVVGVATLGVEIKDLLDVVAHDLDFTIMDAVGSVAMERLTKAFWHDLVCSCRESGQGLTMRYSPGEDGWLLREQRTVFELLSGQDMAVQLKDRKSVV